MCILYLPKIRLNKDIIIIQGFVRSLFECIQFDFIKKCSTKINFDTTLKD